MPPHRILAQHSLDMLARQLMERREAAADLAEAFSAEARDAQATADNSDRLDPTSPIGRNREESFALAARAYETFREADRALNRIDDGTYGYCDRCGEPIPYQRLRALPAATLCVSCKNRTHLRRAVRVPAAEGALA